MMRKHPYRHRPIPLSEAPRASKLRVAWHFVRNRPWHRVPIVFGMLAAFHVGCGGICGMAHDQLVTANKAELTKCEALPTVAEVEACAERVNLAFDAAFIALHGDKERD